MAKKILVSFATSGAGHKIAAVAIKDYLEKSHQEDFEITYLDSLDKTNPFFKYTYPNGYEFLAKKLSTVWGFFYWLLDIKCLRLFYFKLRRIVSFLNCRKLQKFIADNDFDVIVTTHFLLVEIISHLKKKNAFKGKLITVVTDFGAHNFWISRRTDKFIVAADITKEDLKSRGVPEDKIEVLGIPIREIFTIKKDKRLLLEKLDLEENVFTVFICGGVFGAGPLKQFVERLSDTKLKLQLLVVCGMNKNLFDELRPVCEKARNTCRVFGYIDNIDELMRVSDVIISKSGGLTSTESMALGLPMIINSPIPGQETRNANFLENHGAAIILNDVKDIENVILELSKDVERVNKMKEACLDIAKPNSTTNLVKLIEDLSKE